MAAKILVTGASGFIGQALCRRLIMLGHEVYGLGRNDSATPGFTSFYRQDITKPFTIDKSFDFVFHLAAHNVTHVGSQAADLYNLVNVQGTANVLKAVTTKHFIFLSSAKVYLANGKSLDEDAPLLPLHEYEKSKYTAEQICRQLREASSLLILRAVNIVGPGQPEKAVIPVFFKKARVGETLEVLGPRGSILQLLFVEDAVDVFVKVVEKENVCGIFNLASEDHIRLDDLAENIKRICHAKSEIRFANDDTVAFSPVISTKLEKVLAWKAKTKIKDILEQYK